MDDKADWKKDDRAFGLPEWGLVIALAGVVSTMIALALTMH